MAVVGWGTWRFLPIPMDGVGGKRGGDHHSYVWVDGGLTPRKKVWAHARDTYTWDLSMRNHIADACFCTPGGLCFIPGPTTYCDPFYSCIWMYAYSTKPDYLTWMSDSSNIHSADWNNLRTFRVGWIFSKTHGFSGAAKRKRFLWRTVCKTTL